MSRKRTGLDANAIPWQDFVAGYRVAMEAIMGEGAPDPVEVAADTPADAVLAGPAHGEADADPSSDASASTASDPDAARARLEKDPYARVLVALRAHFGPSYPLYRPLLYRFWGLYDLVHRGRLPEWVAPTEDGTLGLHPALLLAAADVKLTKKGKLPVDRFRERVQQIIEDEALGSPESTEAG